ncbi:hypothetical protein B6E66_13380 [Streptomyces maremycinicus]|nr:hypothetical protein B6E66_13380 [Streptomyces sp. B9173]
MDAEFSVFYRANIRPLTGFLIVHGAQVQVAADIAQDVMTDAYRHWTGITHPKAWVYKAASRALVRKVASVEEAVDDVPEPSTLLPRPDAIAEWEARHDALPMLRSLPMKQRQVMAWTLAGFSPFVQYGQPEQTAAQRGDVAGAACGVRRAAGAR